MSNLLSGSLIDKSPEARSFINQCVGNIDEFKLFPWESFTSIVEAIYSTTNVDLQGECFDLNGLQSLVDKVKSGPFYTGRNHDPLIHPIGRILTARVFQDRQTRCFFTAGITGFYDTQKIPTFESIGIETEDSAKSSGTVLLEFVTPSAEIEFNPHEFDQNFIDEILSDAPQLVTRSTDFQFRKSADPISILCFSVSLSAILCTPFAKKFQEKLGEEAATQAIAFAKWIGKSVAHKIGSMKKPSRLILQTRYQHCRLEFVIESKDPTVISRAAEALDDAAAAAIRLCNTLSPDDPSRLVYEFNGERNIWQPCYAITARTGVIVAQPHLLLAEHLNGGFSLGGTLTRREEKEV